MALSVVLNSSSNRFPSAKNVSRTNTVVITGISPRFFQPQVLDALKNLFSSYGEIYAWAPISAFGRVILVYFSEDSAEAAKLSCDGLKLDDPNVESFRTVLRVYRGDPTPIDDGCPTSGTSSPVHPLETLYSPHHLHPPKIEKNFLISPPGSPPVGWEPVREEPPNNAPLADDLAMALRRLQFAQENPSPSPGVAAVLVDPNEGVGVGIFVEDCDSDSSEDDEGDDSDQHEGWFYGQPRSAPIPTQRPPIPVTVSNW